MHAAPASPVRSPHPALFTALIVPFGALGGFVSVVLAFLATRRGLSVEEGASLIAVGMLPHTWKFFWAPVADMTFSRKGWYIVSNVLCALGVLLLGAIPLAPENLNLLRGVIFIANLASTTLGMATEGLMAHTTAPEQRGRVGGWFQAGNLGGAGIGGGLGLWIATHAPAPWMAGAVEAAIFLLCCLPLLWIHDHSPIQRTGSVFGAVKEVARDLWGVLSSRAGLNAAILCFLPIGTGAAAGVLAQAEVAAVWGAGESEVGAVNGVAAGFVAAFGCILGGQLCARWPSRAVYAGVGALMAAVTGAMALAPHSPLMFIGFGVAYQLVMGLAYAAFTGLVLETIGTGAAATKYNVFAALSNTPITYMGLLLASAFTAWGARGMLLAESGAGIAGILFFAGVYAVLRPRAVTAAGTGPG